MTHKAMVTDSPMQFFSENVDSWGAAEWFDRLAKAVRSQDEVCGLMHRAPKEDKWSYEASFETYRNIASSSALRLVRDYEHQIRAALAQAGQPVAVKPLKWNEGDGISCDRLYHTAETPFGLVYWQIERQWGTQGGYIEAYGEAETDQAAKAAAQSDYERRILSALSTASTPADGEGTPPPVTHVEGLTAFAKAMIQVAFQGGDISGSDIQELGVQHGLLSCVPFDPEKHKDPEGYAEEGDYWYVYAGPLATTEAAE